MRSAAIAEQKNTAFLNEAEPIIRKKIKQYGRYVSGYGYQDLLQEGFLSALEAREQWRSQSNRKNSNLMTWVWIRVDYRFKELGKIGYHPEESLEDLQFEVEDSNINDAFDDIFDSSARSAPAFDEAETETEIASEIKSLLLEVKKYFKNEPEKYNRFINLMMNNDFCPKATSEQLLVTSARISQIINRFKLLSEKRRDFLKVAKQAA